MVELNYCACVVGDRSRSSVKLLGKEGMKDGTAF